MSADGCDLLCLDVPLAESLRERALGPAAAERAAGVGKALGDPTRLTIAASLRNGGELCGCDLAWITGQSQKLVSHHLKVLRGAELVRSRRDGKVVFHELTELGTAMVSAVLEPAAATAGGGG